MPINARTLKIYTKTIRTKAVASSLHKAPFILRILVSNVSKEKMEALHADNRLQYNKRGVPRVKRFLEEMDGIPLRDVWTDIKNVQSKEKLKYATQKPVKLLERIVKLYSNEGDICLDIFAGSGTLGRACITSNRKFILFDINEKGKELFLN